ncbi:alpha-L-rhamnosidase C-terminal domain-containing protein [Propioniciclava soli]|uniref:Alpha-L-rhamnosidase C-terminal domain-containing protein n=1 Tax=Propioniciclava soli TaxID=2775081 RepID=A0ABZ3C9W6_9ACTN|nr:alpha-L-rhamnosidase C-terminal domain-containing protein [Propioniciclava soli]
MDLPWLWLPHDPTDSGSVARLARFRSEFTWAGASGAALPLLITAVHRYRLFVNGTLVAVGPLKPGPADWFADTVDVAPHLTTGGNVLALEVLTYREDVPGNASLRRGAAPGLSVSGPLPGGADAADALRWRCSPCPGRTFLQGVNTVFLGIQERVDATLEHHGWLDAGFDDRAWAVPVPAPRPPGDAAMCVLPRPVPPLALEPCPWAGIARTRGDDPGWEALLGGRPVTVPAHREVEVDLDVGVLTTAFVSAAMSGGAGAELTLTAAECYEGEPIDLPWLRRKGDRTDARTGDLHADPDHYRVAGHGSPDAPELWRPFWFRTVRYLRVRVTTGDEPLTLRGVMLTRTGYPLEVTGSFRSSSPLHARLWETSLRTLRNCMHDTFEDCPFYEQLQYAMDTRSQALFSLHISSDDRLVRRAISDFAASGHPEGLTRSNAPGIIPQVIPGFSLFWVFMLADHLDHVGDRSFTRPFLPRVHAILSVFDAALTEDGFVLSPPDRPDTHPDGEIWNFVDWTDAWRASRGVPELGERRANTILTFQYATALRSAERIADACGEPGASAEYRARAEDVIARINASSAWDPSTGYYRDSDSGVPMSQHAQVWAVLAGAISGPAARDLLCRAVGDATLTRCSYAMSHSLFDAARIAGAHEVVDWTPWQEMLELNLTTWAEDAVSHRSDCHGWGSVPLQHFPRWVLGVSPLSPGFASAGVDPVPGDLRFAEGVVPTPHGSIAVRWERDGAGTVRVRVDAPTSIDLVIPEGSTGVSWSQRDDVQSMDFELPHHRDGSPSGDRIERDGEAAGR